MQTYAFSAIFQKLKTILDDFILSTEFVIPRRYFRRRKSLGHQIKNKNRIINLLLLENYRFETSPRIFLLFLEKKNAQKIVKEKKTKKIF